MLFLSFRTWHSACSSAFTCCITPKMRNNKAKRKGQCSNEEQRSGNVKTVRRKQMAHISTDTINENTLVYFAERTTEVSHAHEVVQVVSNFISHDLHALVHHILGFVQLLHGKAYAHLDITNRHYLNTILESGKPISTLMDDLLYVARVARFETHKKELGLKETVEEVRGQLHPQIAGRRVIRQAERLSTVLGDLSQLLLAMSDLISNAVKFTGSRSRGRIEIGRSKAREPIISLRGNGIGFDTY